jgi:hypothetical protein
MTTPIGCTNMAPNRSRNSDGTSSCSGVEREARKHTVAEACLGAWRLNREEGQQHEAGPLLMHVSSP